MFARAFHLLAGGQEALGTRARHHLTGERGGYVRDPGFDLLGQQPGDLRVVERRERDATETGVGQPLGDVDRRGDSLILDGAEDQPSGPGAQELPEVRGRLVGVIGNEHVDRALDDVPHHVGIRQADRTVAAADERFALRKRDFAEPIRCLPHLPVLRRIHQLVSKSWRYSPPVSSISS